ncbi:PA14 domain-containing protein [Roseibacillus persicicus]|uniref:PA14 domain-containing protein n=1 Tax=Roseibacillus persicicus TaxID=454148 RepID=A0A918WFQ2_9BACT|nr:PA14 domain-containing protein [Roseibacillus persicicus]GHC47023.1 hypothetical protein GCM10007100_10930 [Roseibacillus persicicus]
MLFLSPWLLFGLLGVGIPILIHLARQQAAKPIEWGAMRFLFDTVAVRRRRIEWEDWLLMACRCLLLALIALAIAMPFLPPDSQVPWLFVLPLLLLGVALFGGSFVVLRPKWRWLLRLMGIALLVVAGALVWMENVFNLKRFQASERRDVALIIDASTSMALREKGVTSFERAVEEAREVVREAPRGTAFTVVLGGPAPEAVTAEPLTHRADVLGVLDKLAVVGGSFRAHEALGMATLALAEGRNGRKEIIVWTDDQRHGWRLENPNAWKSLADAWEALPAPPKLIVRNLAHPKAYHNVAVEELSFSRALVGTDRPVTISHTVANRGSEPVTPGRLKLKVGGRAIAERSVGLLMPGQRERFDFSHRFASSGPISVEASLDAADDLLEDNRLSRVLIVRKGVRVLIVDGNPSAGFFERAGGYLALALAPSKDRNLMDPEVIPITRLLADSVADRDVIILADVARLPGPIADALANAVNAGTGLMVVAGPRSESAFYNSWRSGEEAVLPALLEEGQGDLQGVSPAPATFAHESLQHFREQGDLSKSVFHRWCEVGELGDRAVLGASLANGEPWLISQSLGQGRCLLVTTLFDSRAGNLPAKSSFVPLVHELVTWLGGSGADLNVEASWSPRFRLAPASGGLKGRYFRRSDSEAVMTRVDPVIDFDWGSGSPDQTLPGDQFKVRWEGEIVAPRSGKYRLRCEVDDDLRLQIGRNFRAQSTTGARQLGECELVAGERTPILIEYGEDGGEAFLRLYWTPPGGEEQIIPASAFRNNIASNGEELGAVDPRGKARLGTVHTSSKGQELAIQGSAVPGLYQVEVDEWGEKWFPGWEGTSLPVAVTADPEESAFVPFEKDDFRLMRAHTDVVLPPSSADTLAVLQGKGFGRGIWRWLAIAAFLFFLLESALARWVSKSRRAGEEVRVEFGESPAWKEGGR